MTNTTATISAHPTDDNVLILRTPPDHANEMGRFEPARYDREMRAYLLHVDHLEPLQRFAKRQGMYLIDQRTAPPGDKTLMPECQSCGQPASLDNQPRRCPGCGEPWRPIFIDGKGSHEATTKTCIRCNHTQGRAWHFCSQCGETMPHDKPTVTRKFPPLRPTLDDPMPLSDVIAETTALLPEPEETA